jgi:hypothetical protein
MRTITYFDAYSYDIATPHTPAPGITLDFGENDYHTLLFWRAAPSEEGGEDVDYAAIRLTQSSARRIISTLNIWFPEGEGARKEAVEPQFTVSFGDAGYDQTAQALRPLCGCTVTITDKNGAEATGVLENVSMSDDGPHLHYRPVQFIDGVEWVARSVERVGLYDVRSVLML